MSVLDIAAAAPERKSSGPVQYRSLRDPVTDTDGTRLQLVARVSDDEPFVLGCKSADTAPLDRVNSRNVERHRIDSRIRAIDAALKPESGPAPDAAAKLALKTERERLTDERKALPAADVFAARRVACALKMYAAADEQKRSS